MHEVKLPQLGQSVEEASIVEWLKNEGDAVKQGEPLYTIQTDKAEIECESPADGVLRKIIVAPDVFIPVLTVVALVGAADEPLPDLSGYQAGGNGQKAAAPEAPAESTPEAPSAPAAPVTAPAAQADGERKGVSPRARRTADAMGVDTADIAGSGAQGRVMEADVLARAEELKAVKATPTARNLAAAKGVDITAVQGTGPGRKVTKEDVEKAAVSAPAKVAKPAATPVPTGESRKIALTPMRKIIAQRMADSMFSAPHYYVTMEIDMAVAKQFREAAPFRPSYDAMLIRAICRAIAQVPQVNARWSGDSITELGDVNVGFAVALPTGLIVPVVKQAQAKSLQEIHTACRELIDKAKHNKLTPDDYSGNTLTISNLGVFGVDHFTAIINQPDSAILAIGRVKDAPVVIDGGIYIRPMMNITMSSDHRVIDGALAAQFMAALREALESADF